MGLFRRTPRRSNVIAFRKNIREAAMTRVAMDEMVSMLDNELIHNSGVFRDDGGIHILFDGFEPATALLSLLFGDETIRRGGMQDRASDGCLTSIADEEQLAVSAHLLDLLQDHQPGWMWDVHPSWAEDDGLTWHLGVTIPLEDALTVIATVNSKSHGDSL